MNSSKKEIRNATIYDACNDLLRKGVMLNHKRSKNSNPYRSKGTAISPDEVLHEINSTNLEIPIKSREEFSPDLQLPSSDLLNVLHYYTSKYVSDMDNRAGIEKSLDETALLAFGSVVEDLIDEMIGEEVGLFEETNQADEAEDNEVDAQNEINSDQESDDNNE